MFWAKIRKYILVHIIGIANLDKLVKSLYGLVRPVYEMVSYVLASLENGTITEKLIEYTRNLKNAIEAVMGIIERIATYFYIELPRQVRGYKNVDDINEDLDTATKDALGALDDID